MKKYTNALILLCAFSPIFSFAQAPAIQWEKSLGGTSYDECFGIEKTTDSGYIAVGYTNSNDGDVSGFHGSTTNSDGWVVKLNSSGTILWQKTLGGLGTDVANMVQQTADSGFVVAGYSESNDIYVYGNHGLTDYWVVKLNDTGGIQWQKLYGGSDNDQASAIRQTFDGGYIVTGTSFSVDGQVTGNHGFEDIWVVKLNDTGAIQWEVSLGGSGHELAGDIQQTADSGYIVASYSTSSDGDLTVNYGSYDDWIVKLSKTGSILWQKFWEAADMRQSLLFNRMLMADIYFWRFQQFG